VGEEFVREGGVVEFGEAAVRMRGDEGALWVRRVRVWDGGRACGGGNNDSDESDIGFNFDLELELQALSWVCVYLRRLWESKRKRKLREYALLLAALSW
jgi:hypothetical protein